MSPATVIPGRSCSKAFIYREPSYRPRRAVRLPLTAPQVTLKPNMPPPPSLEPSVCIRLQTMKFSQIGLLQRLSGRETFAVSKHTHACYPCLSVNLDKIMSTGDKLESAILTQSSRGVLLHHRMDLVDVKLPSAFSNLCLPVSSQRSLVRAM